MFTSRMLIALLPLLLVSITTIVVMLTIAFKRNHFWSTIITMVGLNLALLSVLAAVSVGPQSITDLLVSDRTSCFYTALILVSALACTTFSNAYFTSERINQDEMYLLLLLAATGAIVLVSSHHAATLVLGLEILSVPAYGIIAYDFFKKHALEAGLKYLVLSATASGCLLFGLALLYAQIGSLSFTALGQQPFTATSQDPMLLVGLGLVITAIAFKLSLVPFHLWTPDVYEGASAPAGAFLATVSKLAVFAVLLRLIQYMPIMQSPLLADILACIAIASILVGNLLALMQDNLKRLLSYSSISHFGYLLIISTTVTMPLAQEAVSVYLFTYVITTLAAFGVITMLSNPSMESDVDKLQDYRGLFWSRPYLSAMLTICMLSLAGIPLTAGFIGKFYVITAAVQSNLWMQLGTLVIGSAIGVFYYLRVVVTLYTNEPNTQFYDTRPSWGHQAGGAVLVLIAMLVLALGVYPQPLLSLLQL